MEWVVNYWLEKGAPREKLILGIPTYGRTFLLSSSSKSTPGSSAKGTGNAGRFTREAGFLSFYEICEKIKRNWTRVYDKEQKVPYIYKKTEWVSYDDVNSIKLKARYLMDMDLGGAMFWSLDSDDFLGKYCQQGRYPLINAAKSVIENDEHVLEENFNENEILAQEELLKPKSKLNESAADSAENNNEENESEISSADNLKLIENKCTIGDGYCK